MTTLRSDAVPLLAGLRWLAGCWQGTAGTRRYEEYWLEPAGNIMLALSRTLSGDDLVTFEFLRIESRADGIYYVAQPRGQPPTDFRLTRLVGQSVTFENPAHDFPKRIHYQMVEDGSLVARVDGGEGAPGHAQEFHFHTRGSW